MAVQYEEALKKDIASKKPASSYLLFGDDGFLKKSYMDKLINISYDGDAFFNLQKFEGECDLQDVYNAVQQLPMMADRKCVVLADYDFEKASAEDFNRLCELLESQHEECVLLLRFDSVEVDAKRSSKAKKLIAAAEKSGGKAICLDHKKPAELTKVLIDGAAKRGAKMDAVTARYLIETCGADLSTLKNELDKLCFYTKGSNIDKTVVDKVCVKSVEESVYDLTKKIFEGNPTAALEMLDGLFFMRLEPMIILHTISSSYVDLYRMSAAKKSGKSISAVSETFGYRGREFVLERAAKDLKAFDDKKLNLSLIALITADKALKSTGSEPRIVLEQLIIRLIYIILKGETVDKA